MPHRAISVTLAGMSSNTDPPFFSQSQGRKQPMISHSAVAKKSSVVLSIFHVSKRLCLTALLALSSFAFTASATAETNKLIIESGDSAQSRQNAAMDKEQWNDTRSLRHKVNKRAEKEWDKEDVAFDARDKCQQSANVNAYWEPNTLRCLDRRTGRTVAP
ncbi:hypothetical protein L1887_44764 [Cichorium endivia]|nr:hypothetical protein L1887_44764 [Cichorium endivia]